MAEPVGRPWIGRAVAVALLAAAVWSSTWIVGGDEQGVVTRFGRVVRIATAGFHLTMPWPVESMTRVSTSEVRVASVGVSVAGDGLDGDGAQWMTGDTNIVEMRVAVQYVIDDPKAYLFASAPLSDGRPPDAVVAIATRAKLTELVAKMPIDDALSVGKPRLQREVHAGLQGILDELCPGMRVLAVNIAEARPPSVVIRAFNDVASAESDRERLLSEADGYRRDLLPKRRSQANALIQQAKMYRDQVVSIARGAAARFTALADQVRAQPRVSRHRLWLEAMRKVFGKAKTVVYESRPGRDFVHRVVR